MVVQIRGPASNQGTTRVHQEFQTKGVGSTIDGTHVTVSGPLTNDNIIPLRNITCQANKADKIILYIFVLIRAIIFKHEIITQCLFFWESQAGVLQPLPTLSHQLMIIWSVKRSAHSASGYRHWVSIFFNAQTHSALCITRHTFVVDKQCRTGWP